MARQKKPAPDLIRRAEALAFVQAKYDGRACDFRHADCIRMARTHLVKLGRKVRPLPRYTTACGALRALKSTSCASITDLLDSMLVRIPPARMVIGDLATAPGNLGLDAVVIYAGGDKFIGWSETNDLAQPVKIVLRGDELLGAWSAL